MAGLSHAPTPHQQLEATVDTLAQTIEAFVLGNPHEHDRGFLQLVNTLEHAIDRLADEGNPPAPERGLDHAVDTLADTIGTLVHAGLAVPPEPDRGAVLDALAHSMDALVHIGDAPPASDVAPSGPDAGLLAGIDTLAGTVVTLADLVLVSPGPCRELADTIDLLAHELSPSAIRDADHTLGGLAQAVAVLANPPEPDRAGDAAVQTLAHTVDALVHDGFAGASGPDHALVHSADALTHTIDALVHAGLSTPPEPDRALDQGIHNLGHTIDALAHTLPLIDPMEDAEHVTAIDAAVRAVDAALRGGPDGHAGLIPAIDALARAVGEIVPCIEPGPERGVDLALDTLAHTLDFVAHETSPPEPERPLVAGIDTLVHSVDALVHGAAIGSTDLLLL